MPNKEALVFEVSTNNFQSAVLDNSHKVPVLVEFMGVWSGPCIQMAEEMAELANEFAGDFVFAKVDIDEQEDLKERYGIKNVPSLKVFTQGGEIFSEEGQLKKEELRILLRGLGVSSQVDELRFQAREKHMAGETLDAIKLLTQAIQQDRSNINVAMDMTQIFIDLNEFEQARDLYNQLPDSAKNNDMGKQLLGQLTFLELALKTDGKQVLLQRIEDDSHDYDARFDLALCEVVEKNYGQAIDNLLVIITDDAADKQKAARELAINVINMLAPNNPELASSFRKKLGVSSS